MSMFQTRRRRLPILELPTMFTIPACGGYSNRRETRRNSFFCSMKTVTMGFGEIFGG